MDTPLAPPTSSLVRASPSARKSGKDLVKLDCMRRVVGGDLFEHQRALTVVKVFLCKRIERDGGDRRKKTSFTFLSIWGCHWARRWPGCQYVLGIRVSPTYLRQNSRLYGISCSIVGICLSRFVPGVAPLKAIQSALIVYWYLHIYWYLGANRSRNNA